MSRHSARSRAYQKVRAQILAADDICWICGHEGADQIDHVVPASRSTEWQKVDRANLRPAHGVNGCPVCGRRCNQSRGAGRRPRPGNGPEPAQPTPSRRW